MSKRRTPLQDPTGEPPARGRPRRPVPPTRRALHHLAQVSFGAVVLGLAVALIGVAHLADQGRMLHLAGDIRARPSGWALSLEGGMDALAPERLLALWPREVRPGTRDWIAENVEGGGLRDIQLALRAEAGAPPEVLLGFAFVDLKATYMRDMPPIKAASGQASISDNRFVLYLDKGHVDAVQGGRVDIAGSSFAIPDIRVNRGPAQASLTTRGSITAALSLLDAPPFRLTPTRLTLQEGSAVGASVGISMDGYYDLARGQLDMQGVISPVYVLNAIGQLFTRRGEGLIGFNYTLKGPAMAPRVAVNPLSALTPGFLRGMFRRPAPRIEGDGPPVVLRDRVPEGSRAATRSND